VEVETIKWGNSDLVQLESRIWRNRAAGAVYKDKTALAVTVHSKIARRTVPPESCEAKDIPIAVLTASSGAQDRKQQLSSGTILGSFPSINESEHLSVVVRIHTTNTTQSKLAFLKLGAVNAWLQEGGQLPGPTAISVANLPGKGARTDEVIAAVGLWGYDVEQAIEISYSDLKERTKYEVSVYDDADPIDRRPIVTFIIAPTYRASLFPSGSSNGLDFSSLQ
jgi:hypothetical protein